MLKQFDSEQTVEFSPHQTDAYDFAVDSLIENSLYAQILKTRPFWHQSIGASGFNLLISERPRSVDFFKQQNTSTIMFNHLPTS